MLLTSEINIRDPFVYVENGVYYMTGTRGPTCWGPADGFDGYRSTDLTHWEGPFEIFHRPEGFQPDRNYWAPEIHAYQGSYYLFATFNEETRKKGTMILKADAPLGPYVLHSEGRITPGEWDCLDGTFYLSPEQVPYMVFCHEWQDAVEGHGHLGDGTVCAVQLSEDLRHPVGEPRVLFAASQAQPWIRSIEHPRYPGPNYITDGPFLYRTSDGTLVMLWSSFGEHGYVEAVARSDNGDVTGNWRIDETPLFAENGGHGMLFTTTEGQLTLVLHSPNTHLEERPVFIPMDESLI